MWYIERWIYRFSALDPVCVFICATWNTRRGLLLFLLRLFLNFRRWLYNSWQYRSIHCLTTSGLEGRIVAIVLMVDIWKLYIYIHIIYIIWLITYGYECMTVTKGQGRTQGECCCVDRTDGRWVWFEPMKQFI